MRVTLRLQHSNDISGTMLDILYFILKKGGQAGTAGGPPTPLVPPPSQSAS